MSLDSAKKTDPEVSIPKLRLRLPALHATVVGVISIAWALFQLALPRLVILDSSTVRAVHLAFAMTLVFLTIPAIRPKRSQIDSGARIGALSYVLAGIACLCVSYFVMDWTAISTRAATPLGRDVVIGIILIVLLLEASRRRQEGIRALVPVV